MKYKKNEANTCEKDVRKEQDADDRHDDDYEDMMLMDDDDDGDDDDDDEPVSSEQTPAAVNEQMLNRASFRRAWSKANLSLVVQPPASPTAPNAILEKKNHKTKMAQSKFNYRRLRSATRNKRGFTKGIQEKKRALKIVITTPTMI